MSSNNRDEGGKDGPIPIKGDVIAEEIRRVTGEVNSSGGLIEIPLVGHGHRYRVRVDIQGPAPRLVELHLISDGDTAEIDPNTIRQIPVRRLAKAAARFITFGEGPLGPVINVDELHDSTLMSRPDLPLPGRGNRKLDDVHYRQVRELLLWAREIGESPREYVAKQFAPVSLPTVDRWIAEAKRRNILRRDWLTNPDPAITKEDDR